MKKCIHCGAEVPEEEAVCPACGQSVTEEAQTSENQQAQPETEKGPETDEDTCEEKTDPQEDGAQPEQVLETDEYACEEEADTQEDGAQEPAAETPAAAAPVQKKPPVWVWIVGALAVVAIVAAILIAGKKDQTPPADATQTGVTEQTEEEPAAEGETQEFVSYTATEDQLTEEVLARVVASCGGKELDNRMLDFYYWQQYYTFANNYGAYLSYLMDTSKGLDEQAYSDTETWQQAFLTGAADMFHSITALNLEADAAGFELSEEDQAQLDAIAQSLDATADYYGIENLHLASGRFLMAQDEEHLLHTVVLEDTLAEALFGQSDPLGRSVTAGGVRCTVVGVLETYSSPYFAGDGKPKAYLPAGVWRQSTGRSGADEIVLRAPGADVGYTASLAKAALQALHPAEDGFTVSSMAEQIESVSGFICPMTYTGASSHGSIRFSAVLFIKFSPIPILFLFL